MDASRIESGVLHVDGVVLLEGLTAELSLEVAELGGFLSAQSESAVARWVLGLGTPRGMRRFAACYRYEPFWMKPRTGSSVAEVPAETQVMWLELESGQVAIIVPLVSLPFRCSLRGYADGLRAILDTGDPHTIGKHALVAYVAVGDDPYVLAREGAAMVARRLGTLRLRRNKPVPAFADEFGWCTWDAFYQEVSHDKVRLGLESFRAGGVEPRTVILDDGWQSVRTTETGERRLTAFAANEKFPGGLRGTVRLAKQDFRVRTFLVWHAVHGYWGGIDQSAIPGYGVETALRWYSPEILSHDSGSNWGWWGACVGRPSATSVHRFYHDLHRCLVSEGVDGVKVDNQASIEGLAHGMGGRVAYMLHHREGLESSARRHFDGRLINCMSCSNDMFYHAHDSTLTRTSTDFWPNDAKSHGLHVYTNAMVGLWFGEFVQPDWDMFQSGHAAGAYHAAARAVSGSPVYVSDKPGAHDFELLHKLVLFDGTVLRASGVGRPTRDCLFANPLNDDVLLKVFNENVGSAVVGIFNARHREGDNQISGSISPTDVPGYKEANYAVYLGGARRLARVPRGERIPIKLDTLKSEIATIVPLDQGVAPIGLADKLNSGGAIAHKGWDGKAYKVSLRDGGEFVAYSEQRPLDVKVGDASAQFDYDGGRLSLNVATSGPVEISIQFE